MTIEFDGQNNKITRDTAGSIKVDRKTSDGDIVELQKDGTTVGSITTKNGDMGIGTTDTGIKFSDGSNQIVPFNPDTNVNLDATLDLGASSARFKDTYLSGNIYLGGTGSANALDDYEEGTFTPVVEGSTTTGTATYTTREAHYTKVGNLVSFNIFIRWQSGTGAGNLKITGLPFTSYATTLHHAVTIGWMNDYDYTNGKIPRAYINNNATRINFEESTDNGSSTNLAYDAQAGLILSGSYQTT